MRAGSPSAKRTHDDYIWSKKNGFCVRCNNASAVPGRTLCPDCAEKASARSQRYRGENRERIYEYNRLKNRERYTERKAAGQCVKCGRRPSTQGTVLCIDCLTKKRRYKDPRYNNDIMRQARTGQGLCYICGEPVRYAFGAKLCEKHYQLYSGLMTARNVHPTEAMAKARTAYTESFRGMLQSGRKCKDYE